MNLILWRHADAEEIQPNTGEHGFYLATDLRRELTERGHKQAERMAHWLDSRLPETTRVLVSPAIRTRQTAAALFKLRKDLEKTHQICPSLQPGTDMTELLEECGWPGGKETVVLVGHNPALSQLISVLLSGQECPWSVKKGSVWWLANRMREEASQVIVRAVINPDLV